MNSSNGFENCTREQHKQMLEWFFYRVPGDQRAALMQSLPMAYNAWHGRDIARVTINGSNAV